MSDGTHLLIPFASATAPGCAQALGELALPNLEKLLTRLVAGARDDAGESSLSMPHERALARACELPAVDGGIPLAAWQVRQGGADAGNKAWAWITPCHWRVARDHVAMGDPGQLALSDADSKALLAAMLPFFTEDGISLTYDTPGRWLANGELFRDLPTASLDRVIGQTIDGWIPRTPQGAALRRLQQEMQMLMYTNAVNEAREQRGELPVNSFWASGTGALPASAPAAPPSGLRVADGLRAPALAGDWAAWSAAWRAIDAGQCASLLQAVDAGQPATITLCGERCALELSSAGSGGFMRRLGKLFARNQAASLLESL
ncbi:MAG: phosphoglycerate mutase [Ramlibacter sp.]